MSQPTPERPIVDRDTPPHLFCDCVPDLATAHCHRCSRVEGRTVTWHEAPCATMVESLPYQALLTAEVTGSLLIVSKAFDARRAARAFRATISAPRGAQAPASTTDAVPDEPAVPVAAVPVAPVPVQRNPTPLVMANKSVNRLVPIEEHELARRSAAGLMETERSRRWRFTHLAYSQIHDLGLTPDAIAALLEGPHTVSMAPSGTAVNHHGSGLLVMLATDDDRIISVVERENPPGHASPAVIDDEQMPAGGEAPTTDTPSVRKAKSGGPGRKMPSTLKEMTVLLREHGFTLDTTGKNHPVAFHPDHPTLRIVVPSSPSDHRSYQNTVAGIKRQTGIDITQRR